MQPPNPYRVFSGLCQSISSATRTMLIRLSSSSELPISIRRNVFSPPLQAKTTLSYQSIPSVQTDRLAGWVCLRRIQQQFHADSSSEVFYHHRDDHPSIILLHSDDFNLLIGTVLTSSLPRMREIPPKASSAKLGRELFPVFDGRYHFPFGGPSFQDPCLCMRVESSLHHASSSKLRISLSD